MIGRDKTYAPFQELKNPKNEKENKKQVIEKFSENSKYLKKCRFSNFGHDRVYDVYPTHSPMSPTTPRVSIFGSIRWSVLYVSWSENARQTLPCDYFRMTNDCVWKTKQKIYLIGLYDFHGISGMTLPDFWHYSQGLFWATVNSALLKKYCLFLKSNLRKK